MSMFIIISLLSFVGYFLGRNKAILKSAQQQKKLASLPHFYGYYTALWAFIPGVLLLAILSLLNTHDMGFSLGQYSIPLVVCSGFLFAYLKITPLLKTQKLVELCIKKGLQILSMISVLITFLIICTLLIESIQFFKIISPVHFFTTLEWSPLAVTSPDGEYGQFGIIPLMLGTLLITFIALCIAVPLGLGIAIYLSEYATKKERAFIKPFIELLAGIPTIVYGFFGLVLIAPLFHKLGMMIGLDISLESALGVGIVMGIMIIPVISSLCDDVIHAVPQAMRDNSYALGATQSETIKKVILRAALPGIIAATLLAIARAIGETMIVVMAASLTAYLTVNPLDPVTTVTVQIVSLLTGDQAFDSPKTLSAFALALVLFSITLFLNYISSVVVTRHRIKYE